MNAPRITFVLVTYGGGELAAHCLDVLAAHTPRPYDVVVVDSASPDGTGDWLAANLTGATVLRMPTNLGFGAGCNLGVQHANTEFVCFLNADVEVTPGWLDPLLALLDERPAAAAVAPLMVFPDGRVQEAGSVLGGDGFSRGWLDGATDTTGLYPRVVDYGSAACLVVRRRAFWAAGGFSPEYHIAYYEDTDLQFQLRAMGSQVWLQPASRVVHVRHGTSTTATAEALSEVNRRVFQGRWGAELATRPPALGVLDRPHRLWWLRDHPAGLRVLVLADRLPRPDRGRGDARALATVRAWRAAHPAVALTLLVADAEGEPHAAGLRASGVEVVCGVPDAAAWSRGRIGLYDVVVALGPDAHAVLGGPVTAGQAGATRVFDLAAPAHRAPEQRFERLAAGPERRALAVRAARLRERGAAGIAWADVVVCGGESAADWAGAVAPDTPVHVAPGPVALPATVPGVAGRAGLVFVGEFGADPVGANALAAAELAGNLLPALAGRHPGLRLRVLGADPTPDVLALHGGRVDVLGAVPDVRPHLATARLHLAPVRFSAGAAAKLVESMAVGLPFVTTAVAAGLPLGEWAGHLVAESAAEFVERADRLLADDALWADAQAALRELCRAECSTERFAAGLAAAQVDCGVPAYAPGIRR